MPTHWKNKDLTSSDSSFLSQISNTKNHKYDLKLQLWGNTYNQLILDSILIFSYREMKPQIKYFLIPEYIILTL